MFNGKRKTQSISFEMQCYAGCSAPGPNPYTWMLGRALSATGFESLPANSVADIWHVHWLHLMIYIWNAEDQRSSIRWRYLLRSVFRLLFRRFFRKPTVWTIHNLQSHEKNFTRLERAVVRLFARLCDALIVHTNAARNEIQAQLPFVRIEKIHVIPHPAFAEFYPNTTSKSEARRRLGLDNNTLVFLAFGMLRGYKGYEELVSVFRSLDDRNARLLIVGEPYPDGKIAERLKLLAGSDSRIGIYPGHVAPSDVQFFFKAADAAVFPYRKIFTSGGIVLAQCFGVPCIAPALPPIREILENCGGYLFSTGKSEALLATLQRVISSSAQLPGLGYRHREAAMKQTWAMAADSLGKVYNELLAPSKLTQQKNEFVKYGADFR